jgi:hypothetical protein
MRAASLFCARSTTLNIAHNPWLKVKALFKLAASDPLYSPALAAAPDAWTIAVAY